MESNFDHEYDLLKKELDRAEALQKQGYGLNAASASANTITVNAGGIGVYVAVTCCAVMLAVNIFLAAMLINHDRKIDRLNDYVTAAYMVSGKQPENAK